MSEFIYKSTFDEYDKDKSGFIDASELKTLLESVFKKSGIILTEESLNYHLDKFDTSHDGKVSLQEFCAKMDQYNHPSEYKKFTQK